MKKPSMTLIKPLIFIGIMFFLLSTIIWINTHKESSFEDEYYVIGVSQPNLMEPWRIEMYKEIKEAATGYKNIRIVFKDAGNNTEQQKDNLKELMDYDIDLLIVSMNDSDVLTPIISDIYEKIPVIVLDRDVDGYDYTLFIGLDNYSIGFEAGKFVNEQERVHSIIEILGTTTSKPTIERSSGFLAAISENETIDVLERIEANWEKDKAEDLFSDVLMQNSKVDAVYAHSDDMAYGAYLAAEKVGLDLVIVGIDGLLGEKRGIDLVKKGILDTTFICPTGGREAIKYAVDILKHEKGLPKKIILRSHQVTQENVDYFLSLNTKVDVAENKDNSVAPEKITLGFAQVGAESSWRLANSQSIMDAAKESGINLIFKNVDTDLSDEEKQALQIKYIREFISMDVDVIAFSPIIKNGWEEVLTEAKDAGIPVILSDRRVDASNELYTTYMGSDFVEEGRRAARWLLENATKKSSYTIVELEGTTGSAPTIGRQDGFREVLNANERFKVIRSVTANFKFEDGFLAMKQLLETYGKTLDVVYSHNDDMALGAIQAIQEYGLDAGTDILVISVDATKEALQKIIIGKLNCAVECNPLLGPQMMKAIKDLIKGEELPIEIITEEGVFTKDNADNVINLRKY